MESLHSPLWRHICTQLSSQASCDCEAHGLEPVSGGDTHQSFVLQCGHRRYFIKLGELTALPMLETEAESLERLSPFAAKAMLVGSFKHHAFLVLPYLDLKSDGDQFALGQRLAQLHQLTEPQGRYGWHQDNFIGLTPQQNRWHTRWCDFYISQRLLPQLSLAKHNGFGESLLPTEAALIQSTRAQLDDHQPKASLLHGDLWRGNAGFSQGQGVFFDPASYYGDRETDLAMTHLFGGFGDEFYLGYESEAPLEIGHKQRLPIYQLYHQLNHLNLFGRVYLAGCVEQVEQIIALS